MKKEKKPTGFSIPVLIGCFLTQIFLAMGSGEAFAQTRLIDLTHPFDETTIYWPTNEPFHLEKVHKGFTPGGYWYESNNLSGSEHGGTHLDAPAHFAKGKWHVDDIPLRRLVGPAIVVDVRGKIGTHPDYLIGKEDFLEWEKLHGRIPGNTIVLVLTGWEAFWPDKKKYLGTARPGDVKNLHFPGFGEEAARFLAHERKIAAVGLDTPSLDYGLSRDFMAHRVFGAANIPGFENLCHLSELPAKGLRVTALPMKIGKGSGAPLRIIAEIGEQ